MILFWVFYGKDYSAVDATFIDNIANQIKSYHMINFIFSNFAVIVNKSNKCDYKLFFRINTLDHKL